MLLEGKVIRNNIAVSCVQSVVDILRNRNKLDRKSMKFFQNWYVGVIFDSLSALISVELDNCLHVSDTLLNDLTMSHRFTLQRLSLRGCLTLTDSGMNAFCALRNLEDLDVSFCRITDKSTPGILGN